MEILCNDNITIIQLTEKEESMLGNTDFTDHKILLITQLLWRHRAKQLIKVLKG